MFEKRPIFSFTWALVVVLSVSFGLHFWFLESLQLDSEKAFLIPAYLTNFVLALIITIGLYLLRERQANNLGFIFMGSSFIKFAVFFIFFYPTFNNDGGVSHIDFGLFFIPYATSLTIETTFLVRILSKM
jgi:hypothetical protein